MVYHKLSHAIRARYIRFRPTAWHGHISMRVEVYGCKGNTAFSSKKLAYHFLAVLFHTRQQLAHVAIKKQNKKQNKNKKQKTLIAWLCYPTSSQYMKIFYSLLRAVFCKDRLRVCKIEKSDFPKLCQREGLDELFLKI